jgi:hypothetical protein
MGRLLLALLAAALVAAGPAEAKGPHAILMPGNDAPEAGGRPWEVTLELMEFGRQAQVALLARQGNREAVASLRTAPAEFDDVRRYTAQLVFPAEGRWELLAISGKRHFDFAPIDVGSGRVPRDYVAFAVGSRAEREGAGGAYFQSGEAAPSSGGEPLPPEEFTVAAPENDGGGLPIWVFPLAGVVLAGAGVLRLRSR